MVGYGGFVRINPILRGLTMVTNHLKRRGLILQVDGVVPIGLEFLHGQWILIRRYLCEVYIQFISGRKFKDVTKFEQKIAFLSKKAKRFSHS